MSTFTVFGCILVEVVGTMFLAVAITLLVKDILAARRMAKAARAGFPWTWDK